MLPGLSILIALVLEYYTRIVIDERPGTAAVPTVAVIGFVLMAMAPFPPAVEKNIVRLQYYGLENCQGVFVPILSGLLCCLDH